MRATKLYIVTFANGATVLGTTPRSPSPCHIGGVPGAPLRHDSPLLTPRHKDESPLRLRRRCSRLVPVSLEDVLRPYVKGAVSLEDVLRPYVKGARAAARLIDSGTGRAPLRAGKPETGRAWAMYPNNGEVISVAPAW